MTDVTQILSQINQGDGQASELLLAEVYLELRKLAREMLQKEKPGQTLQATALVHEAYLRLVDQDTAQHWNSRGHFFGAAAEAMRRILVEQARRKNRIKHGGEYQRVPLEINEPSMIDGKIDLLLLDDLLEQFELHDSRGAQIVKLKFYAGLSNEETAEIVGISIRDFYRELNYAKAWLLRRLSDPDENMNS